jgi:hypothetical protein
VLIKKDSGVLSYEMVCHNQPAEARMGFHENVIDITIGNHENLEVVLYNQDSIYGKVHIMRNSPDPVAVSIANQELLELLQLAPNIYEPSEVLLRNATSDVSARVLSLTR